MNHNLYLQLNQEVRVDGDNYVVKGWIEFSAVADGCSWREYKLKRKQGGGYKWLSIDENYHEYAIYEMTRDNKLFEDVILSRDGYKKVDSGKASVLDYGGNIDVERGERVSFTEYEDPTEEKIRAIEYWEGEVEYATGYYLDAEEIIPLGNSTYNMYEQSGSPIGGASFSGTSFNGKSMMNGSSTLKSFKGIGSKIIQVGTVLIVLFMIICSAISGFATKSVSKYLKNSVNFTYVTSITSDINTSQKADVYKTSLSVQEATENILSYVAKSVTSMDESAEGGAVTLLTKKEYVIVYTSEDNETLVQVSNREYAYSSRNDLYRSRSYISSYYRRYYYAKGYMADSKRYKNATSGYEDYTDSTVEVSNSTHYKDYTNTIKQQSTASRSSSGGGTSSGK